MSIRPTISWPGTIGSFGFSSAVDNVKVGAAHTAGGDANPYLTGGRLGIRPLDKLERLARTFQRHCTHSTLAFSRVVGRLPSTTGAKAETYSRSWIGIADFEVAIRLHTNSD